MSRLYGNDKGTPTDGGENPEEPSNENEEVEGGQKEEDAKGGEKEAPETGPKEGDGGKEGEPEKGPDEKEKQGSKTDDAYELKRDDDSLLSETDFSTVEKYAKEHKLTKDQATNLLELSEDLVGERLEKIDTDNKKQIATWKENAMSRPEYQKELKNVDAAIDKFGDKELKQVFNKMGYRHLKPVWEFLNTVGAGLQDDEMVRGEPSASPKEPPLGKSVMFPNM